MSDKFLGRDWTCDLCGVIVHEPEGSFPHVKLWRRIEMREKDYGQPRYLADVCSKCWPHEDSPVNKSKVQKFLDFFKTEKAKQACAK